MTEDWKPTNDQKSGVISRTVDFISEEVQELIEELGCPKSFGGDLLRSIAKNIEDDYKAITRESSYASRHASSPEDERSAKDIVTRHEKMARESIKAEGLKEK